MTEMFEQCRTMMEAMMAGAESWMGGIMPMGAGMSLTMALVSLAALVLLVGVAGAIAWLILRGRGRLAESDSRHILDLRYARGEVDRETYLRMRSDLTDGTATPG